ncbi:hypothetical protein VTK73DRAFT_6987 [Phialemonium thermophilum]|uniref:Tafazzin n=1 Tax=Phialemonium thermophilum TaxID=223376 RepID=A0ABR3WHT9_9PEZI
MPKKRHHQFQFSKPQSTVPASLSSRSDSSRPSSRNDNPGRSVNERLADLRRVSVRSQQPLDSHLPAGIPTVPPSIRRILQLPETPPPTPRRPVRVGPDGTRLPPGPPPPRSWLALSRHAPADAARSFQGRVPESYSRHGLPGAYLPAKGSLMDVSLRCMASDWEFQRSYNRYYLFELPSQLRSALVTYLGIWSGVAVSVADLRAILLPCAEPVPEGGGGPDGEAAYEPPADPSSANEDLHHLDLTGLVGRSIRLRELSDLLFPSRAATRLLAADQGELVQESWETAVDDATASAGAPSAVPRPLLPNLTHLSLAVTPESASSASWRQLLAFASHLPTLSHLSLAYWPPPSLTPNANAQSLSVASPHGTVPYGGTGFYSHSLDDDWSEAVLVLRRLGKRLYGLEYLDLTGCAEWFPALAASVDGHAVDWVGDWGKVETLLMYPGYGVPSSGDGGNLALKAKHAEAVDTARRVERHVRAMRAGKGRRIVVETDKKGVGFT